ncbi:PIG-L deacetylase family protein [Paraliomyxa miuraensis]|uniref:PIG-L deacetylase family protein n=1 Tax=Paraliomyxa miuraensis TaxID=376150 RepID=UPI002256FF93|nr:PIG-L family deacetylase [Paraliomyxa miuraensis]MCX4245033.1 PIG-L family deacetylase [Paraliomyxa miuraensis]
MTLALFLSPHLDDAILSCAGRIQRHVARGDRVVLLTVFSHADPDDVAGWAARRREDEAAAARLHAQARWLGLPDAPFRDPSYVDFDALTGDHAPGDATWRERLAARLCEHLDAERPAALYVPLGVGDHVDHRLTHEAAALALAEREPQDSPALYHYEDVPYAMVLHATRRRLDALGWSSHDVPPGQVDAYLDALAHTPYIASYLPPGPVRDRSFARLRQWPASSPTRSLHAELERLDHTTAARSEDAIWDYASQAPALFHTRERYRDLARTHAERLHTDAPRAERYWRLR